MTFKYRVSNSSKRFDVTTIGETMLRLSVPVGQRLAQASAFEVQMGGSESNVCAALAGLGRRCGWVSQLPNNPLGHLVLRQLQAAGINTEGVRKLNNSRMGTYFVEFSTPPRPTEVYYDRASSAAAQMRPENIDWNYLLDSRLLHLTGITPALSTSCREVVLEALARAKAIGLAVSFDVNYRSKLWSPAQASAVLSPIIAQLDVLICKKADATLVFGCDGATPQSLRQLQVLTSATTIVMTDSANKAVAWVAPETVLSQPSLPVEIVDRFGAGDAFTAGVIDGYLDNSIEEGLRRGVGLAALALTQYGDMVVTTRNELTTLISSTNDLISR